MPNSEYSYHIEQYHNMFLVVGRKRGDPEAPNIVWPFTDPNLATAKLHEIMRPEPQEALDGQ